MHMSYSCTPTGEELEALIGAGALPVGLGPNRLRVETAALSLLNVAALYLDSLQIHDDEQDDAEQHVSQSEDLSGE